MHSTESAEQYIVNRYKLWQRWPMHFGYKHAKGARIARIIEQTGGPVRAALEIGVGPGGVAAALSRTGMKVIGLDLSPDALVWAREHCAGERVSLMRASGFSLPLAGESLDLAYCSQVLHLFNSPERLSLMREVRRVLAPGGRFIFDMKNVVSHPMRYLRSGPERRQRNFPPRREIVDLLRRAGFSRIVTRPGLLPLVKSAGMPDVFGLGALAHTTFYIASR